jgi:transcriptional regulator with XRE-family HTH domain
MGGKGGETLGTRLKALRQRAGFTQQKLANEAGLSMSQVTAMEYGYRSDPKLSTLLALAKALHCSLDELAGWLVVAVGPEPKRKGGKKP